MRIEQTDIDTDEILNCQPPIYNSKNDIKQYIYSQSHSKNFTIFSTTTSRL